MLADFLAALGVDGGHLPRDIDARAALYRTHTTGKRMLVLLDNAATADQVVPLLPGGDTCTVLITSRNRLPTLLTRHSARPVRVDVLSDAETRTLLTTALADAQSPVTSPACGHRADHAVRRSALALGLIAARIRTHPHLLDDIVADLREFGLDALSSDDPDACLAVVLSWSLPATSTNGTAQRSRCSRSPPDPTPACLPPSTPSDYPHARRTPCCAR